MMMMNYPAPIHHLLEGTPTRFHAATAQAVFPALATYVPGDVVGKFPLNNETYRLNCGFFSLLCGDSASGKSLVDSPQHGFLMQFVPLRSSLLV